MPEKETPLFLNFNAIAISELAINEDPKQEGHYFTEQKIHLLPADLKLGWNVISLKYFNAYQTNRVGLHTFIDSSDGEQYLYSQFEAFHCYKVFPTFDQPSLKARMSLSVICPQEWRTISNGSDTRYENAVLNGRRVLEKYDTMWFLDFYEDQNTISSYEFEQTPKISTYLYAVCAGPYTFFEDYDPMHIPQRIFVRKSLVKNLRHELIFGITKTTIDFYQKILGQRYPFSKVDHVMCPDYKYGAMENVACITYSDGIMCSSAEMSIPQLTFFCVVI
mmetsp:Transcript_23445/g.36115  ORF Transcript_23445/g.36115 Transcript_23445/m.36115 type:complete len:277 (-) Transcript_23445:1742-2572(-)